MELPEDISSCHRLLVEQQSALDQIRSELLELMKLMDSQIRQIDALRQENKNLALRNKELESQLNQNSRNSSRPPSTDRYKGGAALPRKTGGDLGGKPGHKGSTLEMVSTPDCVEQHKAGSCSCCGKAYSGEALEIKKRRQMFDIPPPKIEVTEHQLMGWACNGCGQPNTGDFPGGVNAPAQYGSRLMTMSVLLNNAYAMPRNKVQQLFLDLFGVKLNEATLQSQQNLAYTLLEDEEKHIKSKLLESKVLNFDESGIRVSNACYWEHVASNPSYTLLFVHKNRGEAAHEAELSILPHFNKRAVHDCWSTYFKFDACEHATCGAHLLRELTALTEQGSQWAGKFHALLLELYTRSDQGQNCLPDNEHEAVRFRYRQLLQMADNEEPPPIKNARGKPKKSKGRNLFDRLEKHHEAVLAFAFRPEVPFTNNQAERDIRPTKIKIKVSGCFRTEAGAKTYARIQSFVSTVRKLRFSPFDELFAVLTGKIPQYRLV